MVVDAIAAGFGIATGAIALEKFVQKKRKKRKQKIAATEGSSQDLLLVSTRPGLRGGAGSELSESLISRGTTTTSSRDLDAVALRENVIHRAASTMSSRTGFKLHNICKSAILYRQNLNEFNALTKVVAPNREWICKHCKLKLSQARLRLSSENADCIWITAAGMLKAHCALVKESAPGWTCIWTPVSPDCHLRFSDENLLLQHMKRHHVRLGIEGRDTHLDWPADMRHNSAETCGFGASIGGRTMMFTSAGLVVPAI